MDRRMGRRTVARGAVAGAVAMSLFPAGAGAATESGGPDRHRRSLYDRLGGYFGIAAAGGPFRYTGLPLDRAHAEFKLTAEEFAEVGAEIVRALNFFGVGKREQRELVAAYRSTMSDVVTE